MPRTSCTCCGSTWSDGSRRRPRRPSSARSGSGTASRPWPSVRRCGMKVDGTKLLEEFRRHLAEHNLPATQQRLAVAEAVFFAGEHLSAEEVGRRVAKRVAVGTATIYRTLDLLVRAGLAKEHDFGEGFKRYEPLAAGQAHEHCICSSCGQVTEFANDRLERMIALLAEEVEFRPHHHRLEIYGLCRTCQQANPLARTR